MTIWGGIFLFLTAFVIATLLMVKMLVWYKSLLCVAVVLFVGIVYFLYLVSNKWIYEKIINKKKNEEKKKKEPLLPISVQIAIFVVLASISWFFPAYYTEDSLECSHVCDSTCTQLCAHECEPECLDYNNSYWGGKGVIAILKSAQHTIILFSGDDNYSEIISILDEAKMSKTGAFSENWLEVTYEIFGVIFFLVAPFFTFWLIFITLFKNFRNYSKYKRRFKRDAHVFSELNDRSLALANSITKQYKEKKKDDEKEISGKPTIVFADIIEKNEEAHLDLVEGAKKIDAILFRKDLTAINFQSKRFKKKKLKFYLISEDESEKIRHAEKIIEDYKHNENTSLYLFSNNIESIKFLDSLNAQRAESKEAAWKIKVLRINDIRSLVYQNLSEHGIELFENATELADGTREISAAIIGLGKYGIEVMKALLWYCQIPGYRVRIHAFDEKEDIVDRIKAICPEINIEGADNNTSGDMRYTVTVGKESFGTEKLYNKIQNHKLTYLFVCLGNDRQNITAATELRNRLLKNADKPDVSKSPRIETVIYDSLLKKRIEKDLRSQNIEIIGDLDSFYSVETVINSTLITKGLDVHKRWCSGPEQEIDYYMNDYNFYSSLASAMHRSLRESIIAYNPNVDEEEKEAKKKEVFPFYYSDALDADKFNVKCDIELLRKLLNQINDNQTIIELSDELKVVADLLYIKVARLKYESLNEADRKSVIAEVRKFMDKKKIKAHIPMLIDPDDLGGYDDCLKRVAFDKDIHRVSRRIFDSIIEVKTKDMAKDDKLEYGHTLEYENLSDSAKEAVMKYIGEQIVKNDFAYIKIAYLKYKELLPEKRKSVIEKLKKYLEKKKYNVNVPMINDAPNYLNGYDAYLEKAYDDKVIKDVLRRMLDFIIEAETETEEKFKVEERFTHEKLSDEEKNSVEEYAGSRTVPFVGIEAYFEKAKAVAFIEHIRWNAYMRSEGFSFSSVTETKNKLHFNLVTVDELTFADRVKDI